MDLADVKRGGAFRRIHAFSAPLAPSSTPSGNAQVWMPHPGEEIFLNFEPTRGSYIQNMNNPSESLTGIQKLKYHQNLDVATFNGSRTLLQCVGPQISYIEFELHFEETCGGSLVLTILADTTPVSHISLDRDKLQGRFIVTQVDLEMRVV